MNIIEAIKESWGWVGIEPEEIIGENDFGNMIIKDDSGRYWRLCPEEVYCEVIAENRSELDSLSTNQDFLADWYMASLTEQAKEELGSLLPGRKFHLVIPSVLGGEYKSSNIRTVPQIEQIHFSGEIGKQISELPNGATVQLKIIE
ncbi:T6SS immunity protein Tdi1 domain-containing protein [Ectopseudomonas mendocina]|uniref:T6SS immunity protein Tdi1 domain-containing protein n=1 Tax=Ectopseudomonas mendocina TaxID=300 RepID=UPI000E1BBA46|nr:T6SS immunity protein Tdi1 domain-containing protein [Pseudomonas mendocina]